MTNHFSSLLCSLNTDTETEAMAQSKLNVLSPCSLKTPHPSSFSIPEELCNIGYYWKSTGYSGYISNHSKSSLMYSSFSSFTSFYVVKGEFSCVVFIFVLKQHTVELNLLPKLKAHQIMNFCLNFHVHFQHSFLSFDILLRIL